MVRVYKEQRTTAISSNSIAFPSGRPRSILATPVAAPTERSSGARNGFKMDPNQIRWLTPADNGFLAIEKAPALRYSVIFSTASGVSLSQLRRPSLGSPSR